jgi:uncharacterized protein (DUF1697 family)
MRAVVLLRGVNVGGVRFAMADLRAALEDAGFFEVRTVLASGNVLLTATEDDPVAIAAGVHAVILQRFGFDVAVIAVSLALVREAVDEYPFPRADDRHAYVVLAETRAALAELADGAGDLDPEEEQVRHGEDVLYWDAPKGRTLDTRFGKHFGKRQRSGAVTTRNITTLEKILAAG